MGGYITACDYISPYPPLFKQFNKKFPDVAEVYPIKPYGLSIREMLGERIMLTAHLMAQEKRLKAIRRANKR